MKKIILLFFILLIASFCYANESAYKICTIPIKQEIVDKCIELENIILKENNKKEDIKEKYSNKIEKENEKYDKTLKKLEEKYKEDTDKLNIEKEKLNNHHNEENEKIKLHLKNELDQIDKNIQKQKNIIEVEINKNLEKTNNNVQIDIDKDILFHNFLIFNKPSFIPKSFSYTIATLGESLVVNDDLNKAKENAIINAQIKAIEKILQLFESKDHNLNNNIPPVRCYIESCVAENNMSNIVNMNDKKLFNINCKCVVNININKDTSQNYLPKYLLCMKGINEVKIPLVETYFDNKYINLVFPSFLDSKELTQDNIKDYYSQLKEKGIYLALFVDAKVKNNYRGKFNELGAPMDIYFNYNINIVDIKTGLSLYNWKQSGSVHGFISTYKELIPKEMKIKLDKNILFSKWLDTVFQIE